MDRTNRKPSWSFSGIKTFDQCPKKYYHLKVAKDYKESETDAMYYGTAFHKAAEEYIKGEVETLDPRFDYALAALDKLKNMEGEKLCEYQMGLTANLEPCGFNDPEMWWRGISDLTILDRTKGTARIVDYKTGKSAKYADKGQLELMALATFKHFPEIKIVKGGLLFVVCNAFIQDTYTIEQEPQLWSKWLSEYGKMEKAYEVNVWNPRPSGLCRAHCIVLECPHNGRR